ncbi:energy transducer TonB [Robiginitomaculum antarcticum]|uniref:energy transducer TonB n=1 Tax=Robiginitomaculum antarcticum TaxID=437507 RepID=UPI00039CC4A7|nr:energy transducer TonB [Robiginitomaculum antarcticum]
MFLRVLYTAIFAFVLSLSAHAKIPADVLKPYKAYTVALENGDAKATIRYAKQAWQAAEKHLGDHKTTGDLAQNYADSLVMDYSEDQRKAYERAIELAHYYEEDAKLIAMERQIKKTQTSLYGGTKTKVRHMRDLSEADKMIEEYGLENSTFHAEVIFLRGRAEYARRNNSSALKLIDKAIAMFDAADDGIFSVFPYLAKLDRGDILLAQNKKIDAALQYQKVMQNVEGAVPADHPYVKRAFGDWMSLRFEFEEDGTLEEAEQAGVCECWPFNELKGEIQPLKRVPPVMPRNANRSGHSNLLFDLNTDGQPTNIRVIRSTSAIFSRPSERAVEQWVYTAADENTDPESRKDIPVKITYRLATSGGRIIPE